MRKIHFYMDAMLLMVLMGLSACVSEVVEEVYEYIPVKTEFSMVVPNQKGKSGRMTADAVQASGEEFRGIRDIRLYPFEITGLEKKVVAGTQFSNFNVLGNLSFSSKNHKDGKSIWYEDVEVPVPINCFLMYGVAENSNMVATEDIPFLYGSTLTTFENVDLNADVSVLHFTPATIQNKNIFIDRSHPAIGWTIDLLRSVLTAHTGAAENEKWYSTPHQELAQLYAQFSMQSSNGGVISASSKSMLAMYEDLYNNLCQVIMDEEAKADAKDLQAIDLAEAIKELITSTYSTASGKTLTIEATQEKAAAAPKAAVYSLSYKEVDPKFPICLNIPDGAVLLKIVSVPNQPAVVTYQHEDQQDFENANFWDVYTYPAALYYTANTAIGTASSSMKEKINTETQWKDFVGMSNFPFDYVSPLTKSIVLKDPVEYAVGNLVTKVKLAHEELDGYRQDEKVNCTGGLLWTGLMVADQREVGWNFTREAAGLSDRSYIVYDRKINGATEQLLGTEGVLVKSETQQPTLATNYTLVYPTKKVEGTITGTNTDRVHLILEFENGDTDFHGSADCLIPAHTRFYIPVLMDLSALKPEQTQERRQIFESDYNTIITLRVDNLKNATNSVPDLRTVKAEMGVGFEVEWKQGFDFKIDVNNK